MSPRRRKAEDENVFAALVRVMERVGPAELTLRAIAAGAGVAGALVQRFGSKRALLLAHARYAADTGDVGVDVPDPDMFSSPLRADTDIPTLARMIEVTLGGSFLEWTLYREDSPAGRLREDLDATLRPYLARRERRDRRR